jgi:hypothetical protein
MPDPPRVACAFGVKGEGRIVIMADPRASLPARGRAVLPGGEPARVRDGQSRDLMPEPQTRAVVHEQAGGEQFVHNGRHRCVG